MINFLLFFLFFTPSPASAFHQSHLAIRAPAGTPSLSQNDQEIINQLKEIKRIFSEKPITNKFNVKLTSFDKPVQIMNKLNEAIRIAKSAHATEVKRSPLIKQIAFSAFQMLVCGRGMTPTASGVSQDHSGWYLQNTRGATGNEELRQLFSKEEIIDPELKAQFLSFLVKTDFDSESFRKEQGFPPPLQIISPETKTILIQDINQITPKAPPYATLNPSEQSLEELLSEKFSAAEIKDLHEALPIETNLYDESVETLVDSKKEFVDYFGRKKEVAQLQDVLTRIEKGHAILTGKAGVGKTTILKILSDGLVQGKIKINAELPAIVLELPITLITNQNDPSQLKNAIKTAQKIAKKINRRIILYIDEAHVATDLSKNSVKSFLSKMIIPKNAQVNMVWSTTSDEAKAFFNDSAFSRRFVQIEVSEFDKAATLKLIKQTYLDLWKKFHKNERAFNGKIDEDAFEYAYKYSYLEQKHAGNPTSTIELLEASIVRKLNDEESNLKGEFNLSIQDIQNYVLFTYSDYLLPDDPGFEKKFEVRWNDFDHAVPGNEGFKIELKELMRSYFLNPHKKRTLAFILFGAPASGKSYVAEQLAKAFFKGANRAISGGEFKNGNLEVNKLIGSPGGTESSKELSGILTKFTKEYPMGGVFNIEEMDYAHQDIVQLFTNIITSGEFTDGRGSIQDTRRLIIQANSNIGQNLMIPPSSKEPMTWEQYETRKKELTETVMLNGKPVLKVKKEKLNQIFDQFIGQIVSHSNPHGDTSQISQEAQKQKRRYKAFYLISPDQNELLQAAQYQIKKYLEDKKLDYGVSFNIRDEDIRKIIDLKHYEFEKGYSYLEEKLETRLFKFLDQQLAKRGKTYQVTFEQVDTQERISLIDPSQTDIPIVHFLEKPIQTNRNPWGSNPEMMARINKLPERMNLGLKASSRQILETQKLLKTKSLIWNTQAVITLVGTSGNGKTEFFKALSLALYHDPEALFTISGIQHPYDFNDYFRPPSAFRDSEKETDFERWFLARKDAGGGVILFDELLSFAGLSMNQISDKVAALNKIYDLLCEGKIRIKDKVYDARGFVLGITGNIMQEFFANIPKNQQADSMIEEIETSITPDMIIDEFKKYGFDPAKIARMGKIFVKGPLKKQAVFEVGKAMLTQAVFQLKKESHRDFDLNTDEEIIRALSFEQTTLTLGMRGVNAAFKTLLIEPLSSILIDLPESKKIAVKFDENKQIHWYANDEEIFLAGENFDPEAPESLFWLQIAKNKNYHNRTPQFDSLSKKIELNPESYESISKHEVTGHWMPSVMINGKNIAKAINIEPGHGYGGYVAWKNKESVLTSLSELIKDMLITQGGHLALFLDGHFASGGGSGELKEELKKRHDDFASINRSTEQIISHHLINGMNEFSRTDEIRAFKEMLNSLTAFAAEYLLQEGLKIDEFSRVRQEALESKFIPEKRLDEMTEPILKKLESPEIYLANAMLYATAKLQSLYTAHQKKLPKALLQNLLERYFIEMKKMSVTSENDHFIQTEQKILNLFPEFTSESCNQLLKDFIVKKIAP